MPQLVRLFILSITLLIFASGGQISQQRNLPSTRLRYRTRSRSNSFMLSGLQLIEHINRQGKWKHHQTTFQAQYNAQFGAAKKSVLRRLAGVKQDFPQVLAGDVYRRPRLLARHQKNHRAYIKVQIPRSFDAREHWNRCADVINNSLCGSCWIVSSATSLADRFCIYTEGRLKPQISSIDALSCCQNCGEGCSGGYPHRAFEYMQYQGIVSGGNFTNQVGCKPYPFFTCKQTGKPNQNIAVPQCGGSLYSEPQCIRTCRQGFKYTYSSDRYFVSTTATFIHDPEAIQRELMTYGPLVFSGFQVFEDFLHYKHGVYEVTGGRFIGLHAIKVIGWGIENDANQTPYWLIANSWGRQWGFNGLVKIRRNTNEANIEGMANSGYPDLERSAQALRHL